METAEMNINLQAEKKAFTCQSNSFLLTGGYICLLKDHENKDTLIK